MHDLVPIGRLAPRGDGVESGHRRAVDETRRLAALRRLDILDTDVEPQYDDLTALAATICGTPSAAVTLIETERLWFKSRVGISVPELPRATSFCTHAIASTQALLVVPDTAADPRFATSPLVTGELAIRFYAGAPLVTSDGFAVGSLCVLDQRPRQLTALQRSALSTLARHVTRLIEHRIAARLLAEATIEQEATEALRRQAAGRFRNAFTLSPGGMVVVGLDGTVTQTNTAFSEHLGFGAGELQGSKIYDLTPRRDWLSDQDLARELVEGTSTSVRRQKHFIARDGTLVPALVTTCLFPANDGTEEFLDQIEWLTDERRAEDRLFAEAQSAVDAIISVDEAGVVVSWNDAAAIMFGRTQEEMLGSPIGAIVPARLVPAHEAGIARLAAGGAPVLIGTTIEVPALRRDGSEFPVQLSLSAWERGGNRYRTAILRDVTRSRRTAALAALLQEAAIVANECTEVAPALARLVPALGAAAPAATVRGWLWAADVRAAGAVTGADDEPVAAWSSADGVTPVWPASGPMLGAPGDSDESPPLAPARDHDLQATLRVLPIGPAAVVVQVPLRVADKVYGALELTGSALLGSDGELHGALVEVAEQLGQVAERSRTAAALRTRSLTDPLTGLANRRRMLELLETEVVASSASPTASVLFLDLDRFKVVNDSLGHAAGDEVLRGVAARLSSALREGDTLARLGGDEFLVLCTGLSDDLLAEHVAQRLLIAFDEPFHTQNTPIYLGASIGMVAVTRGATAETLLRHADIAMYRAKASGGTRYAIFDDHMSTDVRRDLTTKSALHQALRRGEIEIYYQPVVRPADRTVVGLEALVRWRRPGHGLVAPADFIQLAEDTGLIIPIGAYVLQVACRQLAEWRVSHPRLASTYVAVNVAASQLHTDFALMVTRVLAETGLPAAQLTLEITEGALLREMTRTSELLDGLRKTGVVIALDDFGTGYSSLSYLRQLPVDVVKIDRSFVTPLGTSPRADALVRVVMELAKALDLRIVVEGVETRIQSEGLHLRECDAVQGYYYSRPVPAADLPRAVDRIVEDVSLALVADDFVI